MGGARINEERERRRRRSIRSWAIGLGVPPRLPKVGPKESSAGPGGAAPLIVKSGPSLVALRGVPAFLRRMGANAMRPAIPFPLLGALSRHGRR